MDILYNVHYDHYVPTFGAFMCDDILNTSFCTQLRKVTTHMLFPLDRIYRLRFLKVQWPKFKG